MQYDFIDILVHLIIKLFGMSCRYLHHGHQFGALLFWDLTLQFYLSQIETLKLIGLYSVISKLVIHDTFMMSKSNINTFQKVWQQIFSKALQSEAPIRPPNFMSDIVHVRSYLVPDPSYKKSELRAKR